jgi:voltage-gated potassium channel
MDLQRRVLLLSIAIIVVIAVGIIGFFVLGRVAGGQPSVIDCAYQTVITLSTVGSREIKPLTDLWYGKLFIVGLILSGMGVLFVFATSMTAFLVEGEIRHIFRRKKMDKALENLDNHIIVCGAGDTGGYVIEELLRSSYTLVVVDTDEERIERLREVHRDILLPYVVGPAADDEILQRAGIERARGVVIALPDERDNLFITVTARQASPSVKIIARAADKQAEQRLKRAGANAVVSPNRIGGMRMASEMVRPQVVTFLDKMLSGQEKSLRIEEIPLTSSCSMVGKALRDTNLRREKDLLVLAIRDKTGEKYLYNPPPDEVLEEGSTLIVLGPVDSVHEVRDRMTSRGE